MVGWGTPEEGRGRRTFTEYPQKFCVRKGGKKSEIGNRQKLLHNELNPHFKRQWRNGMP